MESVKTKYFGLCLVIFFTNMVIYKILNPVNLSTIKNQNTIQNTIQSKYVVYECGGAGNQLRGGCGGWGDRLRGKV